jgi:hypothetical protein
MIIGKKTAYVSLFSFLVSLKSPAFPDSLEAVALISEKEMIRIGITRIQAFHNPNSNAGIRDTISLFTVTTINYLTLWYESFKIKLKFPMANDKKATENESVAQVI